MSVREAGNTPPAASNAQRSPFFAEYQAYDMKTRKDRSPLLLFYVREAFPAYFFEKVYILFNKNIEIRKKICYNNIIGQFAR